MTLPPASLWRVTQLRVRYVQAIAIERSSTGLIRHMQTQALSNLNAVLEAAGTSLNKAVKITIFLSSMDHYPKLNEAYAKFFTEDPKPVSARNSVF